MLLPLVTNLGSASVPRTHHRPGVHLLEPRSLPSALQDVFAVSTRFLRIWLRACSICPAPAFVARAEIEEQPPPAVDGVPSSLWTRPSMATAGITAVPDVATFMEA